MKSVLISIQPRWCELIANGEKTVEVRKTKPKLETPFKVYIYCTLPPKSELFTHGSIREYASELFKHPDGRILYDYAGQLMCCNLPYDKDNFLCQKVIGEFVCSGIGEISLDKLKNFEDLSNMILANKSCLDNEKIINYLGDKSRGYAWHISDLKIYDKQKGLNEFKKHGYKAYERYKKIVPTVGRISYDITRPPQSWCYVEGEDM